MTRTTTMAIKNQAAGCIDRYLLRQDFLRIFAFCQQVLYKDVIKKLKMQEKWLEKFRQTMQMPRMDRKKRRTAAAVRLLNGTGQFFSGRKELSKP